MSVNSDLVAAQLRHEVGTSRYTAKLVREIIALLNATDRDLLAQIARRTRAIAERGYDRGPFTTTRLAALLREIRLINREAHGAIGRRMRKELRDLAEYEVAFQQEMIADAAGATLRQVNRAVVRAQGGALSVSFIKPGPELLRSLVESQPFQGRILSEWVKDLSAERVKLVYREIQTGLIEGQSVDRLVRRIRGTAQLNYGDGVLAISRRHAETWVRTAVGHVANSARDALYESNADIIAGLKWVSTLDSRTCPDCVARDGKLYGMKDHRPIGHSLQWRAGPGRLHPRDRCTSVPQLKTARALGLDIGEAPEGLRESFSGPVSGKMTAEQWLRGRPQDAEAVYGKTRAKLFLDGGLSAEDLIRKDGELWSLKDLREREEAAFRRVGLGA